jgi:hypothetical protein
MTAFAVREHQELTPNPRENRACRAGAKAVHLSDVLYRGA